MARAPINIGNTTERPISTSSLILLNDGVEDGFIGALERVTDLKATTTLPTWMTSSSSTPTIIKVTSTIVSTSSTKDFSNYYDKESDILLILGEKYE